MSMGGSLPPAGVVPGKGRCMKESINKPQEALRAWAEVDLSALRHNAAALRSILPNGCKLMAIVKSDAYGHGAEKVASILRNDGVDSFAVATAEEGVKVREAIPDGEILVLGYTPSVHAKLACDYDLTQLVVDGAHADELDAADVKLKVHIAIDTGMHRFGIDVSDIETIAGVFERKNLVVEGVATHFAVSDSLRPDDVEFTSKQASRFFDAVDALKIKGLDPGKLHAQASYGVFNYPALHCDYARVGIGLYGVMSYGSDTVLKPELRPVLSLRAVIAQVRSIGAGESVSYGRTFTAVKPMKLATVCIGYADGVPRSMSGNGGMCIVHGKKAPIIGRICMDLLMVDVTGVPDVYPGDVATVIGRDGDVEVRCEEVAAASGTITNEILCRLGSRAPRVYV